MATPMLERVFARREKNLRMQVKLAETEIADNKQLLRVARALLGDMDVPPPDAMEVFSRQNRYAPIVVCVWTLKDDSDDSDDNDSDKEDIDDKPTQVVMCLTGDRGVYIKRRCQKKLVDNRRFTADDNEEVGKALREMIADMKKK